MGKFYLTMGLLCSICVLTLDGMLGWGLLSQQRSWSFVPTTGSVTQWDVVNRFVSKSGFSFRADVSYRYQVDGKTYNGNRIRYNFNPHTDIDSLQQTVDGEVKVYYNPRHPTQSLLLRGVDGNDLLLILYVSPLNALMVAFWLVAVKRLRNYFFHPLAGGVPIINEGARIRIRMARYPLGMASVAVIGGLSLFALLNLHYQSRPSVVTVLFYLIAIYFAGLVAFLWQRDKLNSGCGWG